MGVVSVDNQAEDRLVDDASSNSLSEYKYGKSQIRTVGCNYSFLSSSEKAVD